MEKPDKSELDAEQLKLYNKALRYVAAVEKARQKPHPAHSLKKDTLPEIEDEIQQKIVTKKLKQAQVTHLAEKEIGLENAGCPIDCNVSIVFENNTTAIFFINNTILESQHKVTVNAPLLKITNRLSHFEIPIHDAKVTQLLPFGPCFVRKSKKLVATLEGARDQMIVESPEQTFYANCTIIDSEFKQKSNSVDAYNDYHTYVVLTEKKDRNNNRILEAFIGVGLNRYEAAKNAQEQQNELLQKLLKPKQSTAPKSTALPPAKETVHVSPSLIHPTDAFSQECSTRLEENDESSTISVHAKNPEKTNASQQTFKASEMLSRVSEGSISASQSSTHVKPAFPPAKNDAPKGGSLIYGSLRRAKQAIERTISLKDVKEVKKEQTQA